MDANKCVKMLGYYKQLLADVLEENLMYKVEIQELTEELEKLKNKEDEK